MNPCHTCLLEGVLLQPSPHTHPEDAELAQRQEERQRQAEARERYALRLAAEAAKEAAREARRQSASRRTVERRAQREAAAPGIAAPEQLAARWTYYGGRCWMCGGEATQFEHVKPLARGGSQWPANQRPACWPCNRRKGARWPWPTGITWREAA